MMGNVHPVIERLWQHTNVPDTTAIPGHIATVYCLSLPTPTWNCLRIVA